MNKNKLKAVIGLLFVLGTALPIFLAGAEFTSPRFTAQAEFSVNWNQMPGDEPNQDLDQARQDFNASLAKFKVSKVFISLLCDRCNIPSNQSASIQQQLRRTLKVTPLSMTNHCQVYQIQFDGNDQTVVMEAVNLLSSRFVARLNTKAKSHYATEAQKSWQENVTSRNEEDSLRQELANLSQQQNRAFSRERQAQIQELNRELEKNDIHKMMTGFGALINGVGAFESPAKMEQMTVVTAR